MKPFLLFAAAFIVVTLQACKHPLAIEGEGDIIEITGSGRGCTLEQYQAGDSACTENAVTGDYVVNYRAEPRPGWRFERWLGPCSPDSDFQHCRFEVPADLVAAWESLVGDAEPPASTAVFAPLEGVTGYLMSPTAVAGVAYSTPTQQGVTGLDGAFQYLPGETVSFRIGATLLGRVAGKAEVTPFELAHSSALTGTPRLTSALADENHRFQAVVNVTTLLHTLDADGDPANGIAIRPGIASLMRSARLVRQQHWADFQNDLYLRRVVNRANERHLFSVSHGIARPAPAMQSLYATLGIDADTRAIAVEQRTSGDGDQLDARYEYDSDGNFSRIALPASSVAGSAAPHHIQWYEFDKGSSLRQFAWESIFFQVFDSECFLPSGLYEQVNDYTVTRYLIGVDSTCTDVTDATAETLSQRFSYDSSGNLVHSERDTDGSSDHSEAWEYDAEGNPTSYSGTDYVDNRAQPAFRWDYRYENQRPVEAIYERLGEPVPILTVTYDYDAAGRLERLAMGGGTDLFLLAQELGIPSIKYLVFAETYVLSYVYDEDGKLAREIREIENPAFGWRTVEYQYDTQSNVTRIEDFLTVYGKEPVSVNVAEYRYEYNAFGSIVNAEAMYDDSGAWELLLQRSYDSDGYLLEERFKSDVRTLEWTTAGWGHLFNPNPVVDPWLAFTEGWLQDGGWDWCDHFLDPDTCAPWP